MRRSQPKSFLIRVSLGIVLGFVCSTPLARAEFAGLPTSSFEAETEIKKSQFLIGIEYGQLSLPTSSLSGMGARIGWEYGFSESFSFVPSLGMVTGMFTTSGYLYTGINAMLRYTLLGSARSRQEKLLYNGVPIVTQTQGKQARLSLSLGLEQLILSGLQSAYLAVGPSAGVNYSVKLFSQTIEISARGALMTGNNRGVTGIFVNFSLIPEM